MFSAFHGDRRIKDKYLKRVKLHREHDRIIQGQYWSRTSYPTGVFKGCAVGCTIKGNDHKRYETELGIPETLAHIEDGLFEYMNREECKNWPVEFIQAIKTGSDLSLVPYKLCIRVLQALCRRTNGSEAAIEYIQACMVRRHPSIRPAALLGDVDSRIYSSMSELNAGRPTWAADLVSGLSCLFPGRARGVANLMLEIIKEAGKPPTPSPGATTGRLRSNKRP